MIRIYREHPEFGEYTRFDTVTGRLLDITKADFDVNLPAGWWPQTNPRSAIIRIDRDGTTVFTGETPRTHTRFPRRVYFQITRNCNLSCPYCFLESSQSQPHVPTRVVKEIAAFMGRSGLMEVRLTGGEPTTHPDFLSIVDAFRESDVYVSVATNGMVSRWTLDALAERKDLWVICSVDGARETHNRYRPGTFDAIMANLRYLRRKCPEIRLRLTTVLTRQNMHQIYELGQMTKSLAAESVTVIPLRPQVRDASVKAEMVTAGEFRNVLEEMVRTIDELGIRMTTTLATDLEDRIHKDPVVRKRSSCAAGREATNLDYDAGKEKFLVYGCSYSPASDLEAAPEIRRPFVAGEFPLGQFNSFLDIWRNEEAWAVYRDPAFKASDCHACEYYIRHQCVGSCPIQNVDYSAIDANQNVLAQLKEQLTRTGEWYCYKRVLTD